MNANVGTHDGHPAKAGQHKILYHIADRLWYATAYLRHTNQQKCYGQTQRMARQRFAMQIPQFVDVNIEKCGDKQAWHGHQQTYTIQCVMT